jgi:hypothetical protein
MRLQPLLKVLSDIWDEAVLRAGGESAFFFLLGTASVLIWLLGRWIAHKFFHSDGGSTLIFTAMVLPLVACLIAWSSTEAYLQARILIDGRLLVLGPYLGGAAFVLTALLISRYMLQVPPFRTLLLILLVYAITAFSLFAARQVMTMVTEGVTEVQRVR